MRQTGRKSREIVPGFVNPCLATLAKQIPAGDRWVYEIKLDGYRIQARIDNGRVQLLTRRGLDWTVRFSRLAAALKALKVKTALIDGEVVVPDAHGVSSFVELVNDLKAGRTQRMVYFAFDLLHLNGADVVRLPLLQRKEMLKAALKGQTKKGPIRFSEHFEGDGEAILAQACKLGLEGVIAKRADKPYRSGRGDDWLKLKCGFSDEFVIGGYLDSNVNRDAVGALVVGYYRGKQLVYAGRVGTGYSRKSARELWSLLQSHRRNTSPFSETLDSEQRRGVIWVEPRLVAQVEYRAWTGDNLLRHAAFKALREDKRPLDVRRPR